MLRSPFLVIPISTSRRSLRWLVIGNVLRVRLRRRTPRRLDNILELDRNKIYAQQPHKN